MPSAKGPTTAAMAFGVLVLAYVLWVWPTPWRSWSVRKAFTSHDSANHVHHHTFHFRTNRLDGHMEAVYTGMFGLSDYHPITEDDLQDGYGPLTSAQIKNAERRW